MFKLNKYVYFFPSLLNIGLAGSAVMRDAPRAESFHSIAGPILRRIESNKTSAKSGFHARLAGFAHNSLRQLVTRSHYPVAKHAEPCASIANRQLSPDALGNASMRNDLWRMDAGVLSKCANTSP